MVVHGDQFALSPLPFRTAHINFSGSCAKIDLWWIRGATDVTRLGCSCTFYISASPVSLYTLELRLLIVAGEIPLGVFHTSV